MTESDGSTIALVTVSNSSTGTIYGSTDTDGKLSFDITDPGAEVVLRLAADGYADQIKPLTIADGANSADLNITMSPRLTTTTTFDGFGFIAYTVSFTEAEVSWSPGSFVNSAGDSVNDSSIEVLYSTVDVSNQADFEAFPGSFTGIEEDGSETMIASLGTSEYVFMSGGSELQLAPAATATISLPLYMETRPDTGEQLGEGDLLPIWSLDEVSGDWIFEEIGEVVMSSTSPTGMAVEAEVTHFSWWNIDVPVPTGSINVQVDGGDLAGTVTVIATPTSIASNTGYGSVPIGGSITTVIPSGTEFCFTGSVRLDSGQTSTTETVCTTVATGGTETISLVIVDGNTPLNIVTDVLADNSGNVTVNGFVGAPVQRVKVEAISFETEVIYSTADLPAGVSLNVSSDTSAELAGIPTTDGSYNVVVTGTAADGETDSVSVQYEISSEEVPTQSITVVMFGSFEQNVVNINDSISAPATSWELVGPDPLPTGLDFDPVTGDFSIPFDLLFNFPPSYWAWTGLMKATFPGGSVVDYNVTFEFR